MFGKNKLNFGLLGALFFIEVRQQHRLLCTEQCPTIEKDVSTLLLFFFVFFPNFSKRTCSRKKQDGIPFLVFSPLPILIMLMLLHSHLDWGPDPVIIFFLKH